MYIFHWDWEKGIYFALSSLCPSGTWGFCNEWNTILRNLYDRSYPDDYSPSPFIRSKEKTTSDSGMWWTDRQTDRHSHTRPPSGQKQQQKPDADGSLHTHKCKPLCSPNTHNLFHPPHSYNTHTSAYAPPINTHTQIQMQHRPYFSCTIVCLFVCVFMCVCVCVYVQYVNGQSSGGFDWSEKDSGVLGRYTQNPRRHLHCCHFYSRKTHRDSYL